MTDIGWEAIAGSRLLANVELQVRVDALVRRVHELEAERDSCGEQLEAMTEKYNSAMAQLDSFRAQAVGKHPERSPTAVCRDCEWNTYFASPGSVAAAHARIYGHEVDCEPSSVQP